MPEQRVAATGRTEPLSRARAGFAVAVLCIAQVVSTIDRGMLALMVDPVRRDLAIGEVDIALLQGFAFAAFYVSVGLPLGYVADRVNRRWLLTGGILVWSAGTMACGLAGNFTEMFLARLLIGVGEAVLGPCAVGMISDMYAPERRGRPMSFYVLGSMVAYGLGAMITGAVLEAGAAGRFVGWPGLDELAPWRIAFLLMGLAGVPVAVLLASLAQVRRAGDGQPTPLHLPFAELKARKATLIPLYGAVALFAIGGGAATAWGPALLARAFALSPAMIGKELGAAQLVWALVGAGAAMLLVDRVTRAAGVAGKLRLSGLVALLTIPACLGFAASGPVVAIAMIAAVTGTSALYGTTLLSVIADVVPAQARGLSVALYAFMMTMIGASLGPLEVALLTEHVFADPARVGWSIALVGTLALGGSAVLARVAARAAEKLA